MLHPETTRALADQHINELHRQAAHHLPVSAATARFQGLTAMASALSNGHRRARAAAKAASSGAAAPAASPATGNRSGGSPMGCAA